MICLHSALPAARSALRQWRRGVSIGQALAAARQRADLTVAQVSQRTRIRQVIIRSIERDDYSPCGGDFYARGQIRSIAKAVGTDPEPLIREYDSAHREPGPVSATGIDELVAMGRTAGRRRLNWFLVAGAALVVVLGIGGYFLLSGSGPGTKPVAARPAATGSPASSPPSPSPTPSASPSLAASALRPVSARALGTGGPGQGDNTGRAHLAIDASGATAWRSDWYATARFGNLASGTGLLLDMGRQVTVGSARIVLGSGSGGRLQLRVGSAPALRDLRPVAQASGAGGVVRLRASGNARGRYVLLWFTRLPADQAGTYQASVYDISLRGQR
jgi:hypothetical protein